MFTVLLYLDLYYEESDSIVDVVKGFHEQLLKPPSNHKLHHPFIHNEKKLLQLRYATLVAEEVLDHGLEYSDPDGSGL